MSEDGQEQLSLRQLVGGGYDDFWNTRKFFRVCKGSKGSKKSYTCALWYIYHIMKYPQANLLVIRRFYSDLRDSCFANLRWAVERLKVSHLWTFNKAHLQMEYKPTGQIIMFRGLDDASKLASVSVVNGILCWIWIEEAYQVTNEEEFEKLQMSIRGAVPKGSGLFKQITLTFNPWSELTWLKPRFFDDPADNVFSKTTTYKCNEWLSPEDKERYEDLYKRSPKQARVICDGDWGVSGGLIYDNWDETDFSIEDVLNRKGIQTSFGLDFGYAVSYNAFIALAVDVKTREIWIWDEMYDKGMTNIDITRRIISMGYGKEHIIADSAEPKSIYEIRSGFIVETEDSEGRRFDRISLPNIRPAMKGPDSVKNGIQRIQSFHIWVHRKCRNTVMELGNYAYAQDKDGNYTDKPDKDFDHLMDAMRMAMEKFFVHSHGHVVEAKGIDGVIEAPRKCRRVVSTI